MRINEFGDFDEEHLPNDPEVDIYDSLRNLLSPYDPADERQADKFYTTPEIISSLEQFYGISQSDPKKELITGMQVVETMHKLGYKPKNVGGLGLIWLLKKKD